jgi:peptide deformylase
LAVHSIRIAGDPVLREKAKRVPSIDGPIHRLIEDLIDSMRAASGVGLAAPQIGVSLRVIVIGMPDEEPFALINPEIVKRSGERKVEEGCLSVPGYRTENLTRSVTVVVKGLDPSGRRVRRKEKEDLLAQALEHEIDHLNGTLYIDHLESKDDLIKIEPPDTGPSGPEPATSSGGVESRRGD